MKTTQFWFYIMLSAFLGITFMSCQESDKKSAKKDINSKVIRQLKNETEHFISNWSRPDNLFKIDINNTVLIIVDMQNFVCAPEKGSPLEDVDNVVKNTNKLVDICREYSIPIIWVRHNINVIGDSTDGGLYPIFHNQQHIASVENYGKSTEIYGKMHFDPKTDHIVFKNRYSAFMSAPPNLKEKLMSLNKTQLIFTGVATNVCVESTIRDAMQLNYEVILVSDATTTFNSVIKESSLMNIRLLFGDVRTSESIIAEITE